MKKWLVFVFGCFLLGVFIVGYGFQSLVYFRDRLVSGGLSGVINYMDGYGKSLGFETASVDGIVVGFPGRLCVDDQCYYFVRLLTLSKDRSLLMVKILLGLDDESIRLGYIAFESNVDYGVGIDFGSLSDFKNWLKHGDLVNVNFANRELDGGNRNTVYDRLFRGSIDGGLVEYVEKMNEDSLDDGGIISHIKTLFSYRDLLLSTLIISSNE